MAGSHEGQFVGLGSGVGERSPVQAFGRLCNQCLGQFNVVLVEVQGADVLDFVIFQHLHQFLLDAGMIVSCGDTDNAADAIQVARTVRIPDIHALRLFQLYRHIVVQGQRQKVFFARRQQACMA